MTDHSRRQFLYSIGAGSVGLASLAPTTTPGITGWSPPEDAVIHSDDRPSWIVSVSGSDPSERSDNLAALRDWISSGDGRESIDEREHEASGMATLIAPPADIGVRNRERWLGDGLQGLSYVESIELNRTVSLADPLTPAGESAWGDFGALESFFLSTFSSGTPNPTGVAFDGDMEDDAMLAAREATAATSDDVTLPDTSNVTVGVADTGVSDAAWLDDSEGNTRLLPASTNFVASGDPSGIGETTDGNGHGNWCAAALAARTPSDASIEGFLPAADVLGLKALDDEGSGALDDIAAAIRKAGDEGVDVLNLSLGSPQYSQAIEDALAYAVEQGVIPLVAAGNDRQLSRWIATPASSENAIAVGSTTVAPPSEAKSAYYSNIGPHNGLTDNSGGQTAGAEIDVAAPGCQLESASGDVLTGTSMASPVAAGVAGIGVADGTITDLESAHEELTRTAEPIPNAAHEEVGAGMPSAANLLAGTEPDEDQEDVETDEAAARGAAYNYLSGSRYTQLVNSL